MKIKLCFFLQLLTLSIFAQKNSSVAISYNNSYLAGNQVEVRTTLYPFSFDLGLDLGFGTNYKKDYVAKVGLTIDSYRINRFNLNVGARLILERFFAVDLGVIQVAHNIDFPIRINYDFSPNYYISGSINPTWNRYYYYENKIAFNYGLGLGYYF